VTALVDIRTSLRNRMGVPTSDDFFTNAVLTDAINLALATVEEEHLWPWAERVDPAAVVTAGTGVVAKPVNWRATRAMFTTLGDELDLVSVTDLLAYGSTPSGTPEVWADVGSGIQVAPVPGTALNLVHVYYVSPALLVNDIDTPDLPSSFTGAVLAKAAELLSAREDDSGARAAHQDDYQKWVARMQRSQRRSTGPLRVRVRPGGWI
jgi:hypothetical protein